MRRRKRNKQRKIIIVSMVSLLCVITSGYAAFQTNLNITAKGNIIEKSRVIKNWTSNSNEDFHADFYRQNIVTVNFLDTNKVPENVVESWDVSKEKDGGVMAYILENKEENGKYDLYIGASKGVIANENSDDLFYSFSNLKQINFNENFDTSNTTTMVRMFGGGNNITVLDLSDFDTSKVTNMTSMFSIWDIDKSDYANASITEIIFGDKFITSNVTEMAGMFTGQPLKSLDLSNFDTSKVTNMYHMFNKCEQLTELNLCSFDTQNVTDMQEMFLNTIKLTKVKVGPKWTTTNANTINLFYKSAISNVTTGQC